MKLVSKDWLSVLARHQRLVAAALAGVAVLTGLQSVQAPHVATADVLVAARSVSSGAVLAAADLQVRALPLAAVPERALVSVQQAVGLIAAGPLQRGETLTTTRLVDAELLEALRPGTVAASVRIADAGTALLVREGDHVDLLSVPADGGQATSVATDAIVLTAITSAGEGTYASLEAGALLVVAVTPPVAARLAASATGRMSLSLRGH